MTGNQADHRRAGGAGPGVTAGLAVMLVIEGRGRAPAESGAVARDQPPGEPAGE